MIDFFIVLLAVVTMMAAMALLGYLAAKGTGETK